LVEEVDLFDSVMAFVGDLEVIWVSLDNGLLSCSFDLVYKKCHLLFDLGLLASIPELFFHVFFVVFNLDLNLGDIGALFKDVS
jgi:hypothetical protein